jgi:hypothetical protein
MPGDTAIGLAQHRRLLDILSSLPLVNGPFIQDSEFQTVRLCIYELIKQFALQLEI